MSVTGSTNFHRRLKTPQWRYLDSVCHGPPILFKRSPNALGRLLSLAILICGHFRPNIDRLPQILCDYALTAEGVEVAFVFDSTRCGCENLPKTDAEQRRAFAGRDEALDGGH